MTSEELRQTAAAMLAFDAGKPVEYALINDDKWARTHGPMWDCANYKYRPLPETKTRPMTRAEFPFGAAVRIKSIAGRTLFTTAISEIGIEYMVSGGPFIASWKALADSYEYTTTGVDFHPCTVTE